MNQPIRLVPDYKRDSQLFITPKNTTERNIQHIDLPCALQSIIPKHWEMMGKAILRHIQNGVTLDFKKILKEQFSSSIYKVASQHIDYVYSEPSDEKRHASWSQVVQVIHMGAQKSALYRLDSVKYGRSYATKVQPHASLQHDAQLYIRYAENVSVKSRLQFVVLEGAGWALYGEMAKVMDQYIDEVCHGEQAESIVKSYKVMSEDIQVGRSDSAVVYLSVPIEDNRVVKIVDYLCQSIGKKIAPITVIGATRIGNSYIQGVNVPDDALQKKILGKYTRSLGGMIKRILTLAYGFAYQDLSEQVTLKKQWTLEMLNASAQYHAKEIWSQLGFDQS